MGIRDLWLAVSPASEKRTFTQITVAEGYEKQRHPERCLLIGIDASVWMNQVQLSIRKGKGTQGGENPAVRILFYRLARLLTLSVIPVFVFDGPNRPGIKRGAIVRTSKPHWLTSSFQKFIGAFGFHWYMAPGEAEADLAELNRRNKIDAIISEDSDALVFGACCIIRMQNVKDVGDQVTVFNAETIRTHPAVMLDRQALFFMAILCGGDYNKTGLKGCGWKTACRLARTQLAHSLFTATVSLPSREALQDFLCEWREAFRILLEQDPGNVLRQKLPVLAKAISSDFPSIDVLLLYAKPLTSWTVDQAPDSSTWKLHQPHLTEIGSLCEKFFSWGSSGDLVSHCKGSLWPGAAIRYLLQEGSNIDGALARYVNDDAMQEEMFVHILRIRQARLGPGTLSTCPDVSGYTIEASAHNILHDNIAGLDAASQLLAIDAKCSKISFWIPASILKVVMPERVKLFKQPGGKAVPNSISYPSVLTPAAQLNNQLLPFHAGINRPGSLASMVESDSDSDEIEFVEGPSISKPKILDVIDLCTPPPPSEFVEGSSTGTGQLPSRCFIDLCTPSPSP